MGLIYDGLMYERIYEILKDRIESGVLPAGTKLPSRDSLCREFGTSGKTIRRVLSMLKENGLIETHQRKRPVVSFRQQTRRPMIHLALRRVDTSITDEVLKTGVLLGYPLIENGIALCNQEDFKIPRKIVENMNIHDSAEFWRLAKQFQRFFIRRNENDLSLRVMDSLGLAELRPLQDSLEIRTRFYGQMQELMRVIENRGDTDSVHFDDLSGMYGLTYGSEPAFDVPVDSAAVLGRKQLEKLLLREEVRYSAVYMDLLGLIAMGRYQPGDKLPTHNELQKLYNVSVDTTLKAIQILQEWGVVKAVRSKGIFVMMDIQALKKIEISPHLIACHVRRYLDTLDLLALTIEGVSAYAATHIAQNEIEEAISDINRCWNEDHLYMLTPSFLLNLIVKHTGDGSLNAVYTLLRQNLGIGRSIPALRETEKTAEDYELYEQCVTALNQLYAGRQEDFSNGTAKAFRYIYDYVTEKCKNLGYYDSAMAVYDGSALWK